LIFRYFSAVRIFSFWLYDQDEPPSTDDEDDKEEDDLSSLIFKVRRSAVFPTLLSTIVLLYLLAPHLKLGAVDLPNSSLPLKFGLPALLLSALASAFARQIWYMLARYLRKAVMTKVLFRHGAWKGASAIFYTACDKDH
jgi:hypothetical protein